MPILPTYAVLYSSIDIRKDHNQTHSFFHPTEKASFNMRFTAAVFALLAFAITGYARPASTTYGMSDLLSCIPYISIHDCWLTLSLDDMAENPAPKDSAITNAGDFY